VYGKNARDNGEKTANAAAQNTQRLEELVGVTNIYGIITSPAFQRYTYLILRSRIRTCSAQRADVASSLAQHTSLAQD